jgi:hypothetical protein
VSEERQLSWMAIPHHVHVFDAVGNHIGHVDAVLGDDEDDIFHGVALNLKGPAGAVEVSAERVQRITTRGVYTDLAEGEAKSLPRFERDRWFEYRGMTRFLKRVKWGPDQ